MNACDLNSMGTTTRLGTHAARLERWLGRQMVEEISRNMRDWYGPPIAVAGVPGLVYACKGGDFCGPIQGGYFGNLREYSLQRTRRILRESSRRSALLHAMGFASLSDLISEATSGGKKQVLPFQKVGIAAPTVGSSQSLWRLGNLPSAGVAAAAAPGGTVYDNTVAGNLGQKNAAVGDTLHFVNGYMVSSQAQGSSLLLADLLFGANMNYNSSSAQPITGVPTRYQTSQTAPGNVQVTNVTSALGATGANVTLTYVDQDGNTAEAGSAQAVRASSAVDTAPTTAPTWFYALNAGDTGLRALTNFILSISTGGGAADRTIMHPLAILPGIGVANQPMFVDGINSAFNLERIFDNACLILWEWMKSATAAATYSGAITVVSG